MHALKIPHQVQKLKLNFDITTFKKIIMKNYLFFIIGCLYFSTVSAQKVSKNIAVPNHTQKIQIVETACGECQFQLKGKSCDLAVRINGKAYFVDGTSINDHGDAHAKEGFCNAVSKAEVQGKVVNNRFKATYFKLLSAEDAVQKL